MNFPTNCINTSHDPSGESLLIRLVACTLIFFCESAIPGELLEKFVGVILPASVASFFPSFFQTLPQSYSILLKTPERLPRMTGLFEDGYVKPQLNLTTRFSWHMEALSTLHFLSRCYLQETPPPSVTSRYSVSLMSYIIFPFTNLVLVSSSLYPLWVQPYASLILYYIILEYPNTGI